LLIHKTTRAGCTTALGSEALNRGEPVLMIVPTNAIAQKTIVKDMRQYSDVKNSHIIHVKSNHNCLINQEMCEEFPDLKELPILPLPQTCEGCVNYAHCPITEIIRIPDADGIVLTYSKLVAAMLSSGGFKESVGDKIITAVSKKRNIVFDEVHEIQYGKVSTLTVYRNESKDDKTFLISQYSILQEKYKELWDVVTKFGMFIAEEATQSTILEMFNAASDEDFWKKHLSKTIPNNWHEATHYTSKIIKAIYAEIIDLTKNRVKYDLSMRDILNLYKMMNIVMAERVSIHSFMDKGEIKVNISAVDLLYTEMIKKFAKSMQNKDKRIMLTSATICSYDYGKLFMNGAKPKNISFGRYGDPKNTNDKMIIFADKKTYSSIGRYSFMQKKDEIIKQTRTILEEHGSKNCLIIAPNRKLSYFFESELHKQGIEHDVTYYKSPEMMGVSNKARVMIAIGIAYKPANAFDVITDSYEASQTLKMESIHADTWQAWSRVKDPSGDTESYVYALGVKEDMCQDIIKWGFGRKVILNNTNNDNGNYLVKIEKNNMSAPEIRVLSFKKTQKLEQDTELHSEKPKSDNAQKYQYNIYWYFFTQSDSIYFKSDIIKVLLSRKDAYAEQKHDGSGYFKVNAEISDQLIENHVAGNITIGGYCLNKSNEVTAIIFDIDAHPDKDDRSEESLIQRQQKAERDLLTMQKFLDSIGIPYITEASGSLHSYHIWIVIKPVKASIAKAIGQQMVKDAGIKCEVFPKQATIKQGRGYGNLVKLPFGINRRNGKRSMIQINGEFIEEFDSLKIGIVDISSYKPPEKQKRAKKI